MNNVTSTPFVSTPLSRENKSMQTLPASIQPGLNDMQATLTSPQEDGLERLYPEIYREVYPLVAEAADRMNTGGYTPTSDSIGAMVDNIIKNSGLWYEDEDDDRFDMDPEAVPVQFGFGMPFRRRRRGHHNRNTLRDIIRILLLRELFSRQHGNPNHRY